MEVQSNRKESKAETILKEICPVLYRKWKNLFDYRWQRKHDWINSSDKKSHFFSSSEALIKLVFMQLSFSYHKAA